MKVVIEVEGGLVQEVWADTPGEILIIDKDKDLLYEPEVSWRVEDIEPNPDQVAAKFKDTMGCEHPLHEDHEICFHCGKCCECLDDNERCDTCREEEANVG